MEVKGVLEDRHWSRVPGPGWAGGQGRVVDQAETGLSQKHDSQVSGWSSYVGAGGATDSACREQHSRTHTCTHTSSPACAPAQPVKTRGQLGFQHSVGAQPCSLDNHSSVSGDLSRPPQWAACQRLKSVPAVSIQGSLSEVLFSSLRGGMVGWLSHQTLSSQTPMGL